MNWSPSFRDLPFSVKISPFWLKLMKSVCLRSHTPHGRRLSVWRKSLTAIAQKRYELYWTNPGINITQNSSRTATYHPSRKSSKKVEQDIAGHCRGRNDKLIRTFSYGLLPIDTSAKTYSHQFCANTVCRLENSLRALVNREGWREEVRGICAVGMPSLWLIIELATPLLLVCETSLLMDALWGSALSKSNLLVHWLYKNERVNVWLTNIYMQFFSYGRKQLERISPSDVNLQSPRDLARLLPKNDNF